MSWNGGWAPYVSVAERRRRAMKKMESLRKRGVDIQPIEIEGRKIAKTFWGQAWCDHLEDFSDFENRLPRGRRYVRNGSVCHLAIAKGNVEAKVSGSEIYDLRIGIKTLKPKTWKAVKSRVRRADRFAAGASSRQPVGSRHGGRDRSPKKACFPCLARSRSIAIAPIGQ